MLQFRPILLPFLVLLAFAGGQAWGQEPQKEVFGFRRMLASIQQSGPEYEIVVEGEGLLPDTAVIDISLEHRGQPCEEVRTTIAPKDGIFTARMSTAKTFLPGYYVVVAQLSPWRQTGDLAKFVEKLGEIRVTQAITVGAPEEIKKSRDEQLKLYEEQLVEMEAEFERLAKVYTKVIERPDPIASPEAWRTQSGAVPEECMAKAQALNERFQSAVIPIFPLLHTWAVNGWMNLVKIYDALGTGLTVEASGLAEHGETHTVFLKDATDQFSGYVRGMRAQMLLERHLEVRDRLLNVLTIFSGLYDESRNTYHQAKGIQTDAIKEFWKQISGEWSQRLAEVEKTLPQIKVKELEKDYPDVIDTLVQTPRALRKLWELYNQVVVEGAQTLSIPGHGDETLDGQIGTAEMECWARIYPLMEVLGFNRDVFNKQMNRTAEIAENAEPTRLLSGTMDDYILGQAEKLASEDEMERNQALQAIMGMRAVSLRVLNKKLDSGVDPGSRMEALLLICLGRLGEGRVAGRLLDLIKTSKDDSTRVSATLAVGSSRAAEALNPLISLLKEEKSAAVRAAAATALSFLSNPAAMDVLIEAFMDADVAVRQSALAAAKAVAKTEFQFDPKAPERTRKTQAEAARTWLEQNRSSLDGGSK